MCEGASGVWLGSKDSAVSLPIFLCPHMEDITLHSLKKPSKQRPSCADAIMLSLLIFPSQLSFILRFINSMQI